MKKISIFFCFFIFFLTVSYSLQVLFTFAAVFTISSEIPSSTQDLRVGDEFAVNLTVDSEGQSINAVSTRIVFDREALSLIGVSTEGSIVNVWLEKPTAQEDVNDEQGVISLGGIIPGGFTGVRSPFYNGVRSGKIARFVFVAHRPGPVSISIDSSKILLNDGKGTQANTHDSIPYALTILPANSMIAHKIFSETASTSSPYIYAKVDRSQVIEKGKWFVVFELVPNSDLVGHFEVAESAEEKPAVFTHLAWKKASSPYILKNQNRTEYTHIRWVGGINEADGTALFSTTIPPYHEKTESHFSLFWAILICMILCIGYLLRRRTSLFAILILTLSFAGIFGIFPSITQAADLVMYPSITTVTAGKSFSVDIMVDHSQTSINAISGSLSFPADILRVNAIIKDGSIVKLWAEEPTFSNTGGTVSFQGVIFNPGYVGEKGKVLTVQFTAKKTGVAKLSYTDGSILANDGKGSNVLNKLGTATFTVSNQPQDVNDIASTPASDPLAPAAPKIFSETNQDPNRWYNNVNPTFSWTVPDDVSAVKVSYDKNASSQPTTVYQPAISKKALTAVPDGIYYFHVQFKNANGWGAISHFRFQIDTVAPEPFKIAFPHGVASDNPQPIIYFNTPDKLSGIDHYEVKIGDHDLLSYAPEALSNPYAMPPQDPGSRTVLVRAIDKAGNSTTESADFSVDSIKVPVFTNYPTELTEGDLLKVRGTTYPNASLDFEIRDSHDVVISTDFTKSNSLGDFGLVWAKQLGEGVYKLTARVTDSRGAKSVSTEPLTITINEQALFKIGKIVINYVSLIIIVLVVMAGLIGLVWYIFHLFYLLKRKMNRDLAGIEGTIHREMLSLKEDVEDQLRVLEHARTKRELTREEATILKVLRKRLEATEKKLEDSVEKIKQDVA